MLWSENHRGQKISFHVVGLDVDFEGTKNDSHLAHVAKKINRDCIELTQRYPLVGFSEWGRTGRKQNLFDLAVYSSNRARRTIFSSKTGSENSCFMPCPGFEGRELNDWWIVRDTAGSERHFHTEPWTPKLGQDLAHTRAKRMTMDTYDDTAFRRCKESHTEPAPATPDQTRLEQRLQAYFRATQRDVTIKVRFKGMYCTDGLTPVDSYRLDEKNRHCATCGGERHSSNGAGACFRGQCGACAALRCHLASPAQPHVSYDPA